MNIYTNKYSTKTSSAAGAESATKARLQSSYFVVLNVPQTFEIKYCIFLIDRNLYLYK
jgi:hypothetical protein